MYTFLHRRFTQNLRLFHLPQPNTSILLALSSGKDSLCMLQLFLDLYKNYNHILSLGIIYIDHQTRHDSIGNTEHLVNVLRGLHINSYIYQVSPKNYSENELRKLRYQLFIKTAETYSYKIIATAHTSSDRMETMLYNIMNGNHIDSLNSLGWIRYVNNKIHIIRPLLNFNKHETNWLCKYYSLPVWFDYTNLYLNYSRSRIRYEIIPYIKQYYSVNAEKQISKFLDFSSHDIEYIRQNTVKMYTMLIHPKYVALNYRRLLNQHTTIQIRVLQLFFIHNTNMRLSYEHVETVLQQLRSNKQIHAPLTFSKLYNNQSWIYLV
uniref:tRNA(Ile)-lysidine synthase, chloroplastic n=1 Tax=Yamadaella caenomyce TaxID=259029 RepID=A0A1G4NYP4_9FLOR|nr:tRNA Ile-lysidine synthetase [Yamadaella caenomyce]SCW23744.1 tRNA Ile-lysidine synthetase [Yamadaella caenomyce]